MAKDKSGFMGVDVTRTVDPVAPSGALLESAGALRGKAAAVAGENKAADISFLTGMGKAVYEGYVESEAAKKAAHVTEGLNTPDFVGSVANAYNEQVKILEESRAAGRMVGDPTPELIKEWDERAQAISTAARDKVFSQKEANARLAADMRTLIAQHPAQAARIREVYQSYTGIGDWNTRQIKTSLTATEKADAAAQRRARLLETDAKGLTESGIASMHGMRNTEEVYQHLEAGTDTGIRMYNTMVATNMVKNANKQLTEGDMNTAFNTAVAGSIAAAAATTQTVATRLAQQGIDVNNLGAVTPDKEERIRAAYLEIKSAERKQMEGALVTIRDRIKRDPTMDATTVNNTIKMLEDRLKIPLATDVNEQLNQIRLGVTSRLQTAQTAQAALSVVESGINSLFGKDIVAKMRDPRTRKELLAANSNNVGLQELGRMMESGQSNFTATMGRMAALADYILNPGVSAEAAGAYADAGRTEQGKQDIAAQIKLIKGEGVKAIDAYVPAGELGGRAAVVTAEHFLLDKEWNSVYRSVLGDTYKNVLKNNPELIPQFEQKFAARAKYHLTTTLPNEIKSVLQSTPGMSLSVVNGQLQLTGAPTGDTVAVSLKLQQSVLRANELLTSYNHITKGEYDVKSFLASVVPATTQGIPANSLVGDVSKVPTKKIGEGGVKNPIRVAPPLEGTPEVTPTNELTLAPEMAAKYNQQKTLKGKVEVLLEAGIPRPTIEAAIRGSVDDVLSGKREAPDSDKTPWWKQ